MKRFNICKNVCNIYGRVLPSGTVYGCIPYITEYRHGIGTSHKTQVTEKIIYYIDDFTVNVKYTYYNKPVSHIKHVGTSKRRCRSSNEWDKMRETLEKYGYETSTHIDDPTWVEAPEEPKVYSKIGYTIYVYNEKYNTWRKCHTSDNKKLEAVYKFVRPLILKNNLAGSTSDYDNFEITRDIAPREKTGSRSDTIYGQYKHRPTIK